ncbi:DUF3037 domain-containing protein [Lactonifactor sp. BIOML-A3]|uniref:DUF3037 domain-containing protein n=1 Tax=unclassified Lactonifactor TaxID=2636670 RepID=UPI0012B029EE|nr:MULTISPECIES: DUF3037 domain-containing protein [unclassified Lactonifactor]MSA03948.1 DUF3037 domain-containing protein [Lactonifactor sp. BIOML-A5]MSA10423.1 DUF3037 domain-containing protein [Lactonifactor sp. BIOML-A4]MSA14881.1 DUF3037 domain-containing protein [Lactonifactor sp. BIOML-A3]MSA19425.1 DUF3037 domain-containing protein [Lactonifactor sp. BIOML-A2]MSA40005.1 DUF3037 domain-containing protein [Lactonifactor sp. BIOML-A1]
MYQIEYAALKYYNSVISEECMYIGMLFHNLTTGQRDFRYISNFSRFQAFDDEADVGFVKMYLKGIKTQIETNIFNYNNFSIAEYTRIYVNEFRFTNVMQIEVGEKEDYIENLTKLYLKFDFSKKKRLSNSEEKQYIKRILSTKNIEFSSSQVKGGFEEDVVFDYVIGNIAIKLFSFKGKNLKKIIPTAKHWSFTAYELKEKNIQVVFLYDSLTEDINHLNIIINILKINASVFQIQDGINYLLNQIA